MRTRTSHNEHDYANDDSTNVNINYGFGVESRIR